MKKENLKKIIRDFHVMPAPELHGRDLEIPADTGKIITLVGPRRSGKTSLLFNVMTQLLAQGVPKTSILYLNFEDERLDLATAELDLILQAFLELYPQEKLESCHLFFDEIQNVAGWDRFIRRLYDTVSRNIYLTGSNAKLLSSEIATSLRGRTVSFEVLPLSFGEYLRFRGITPDRYSSRSQAQVNSELERYLQTGGFPEVIGYDEPFRNQVLPGSAGALRDRQSGGSQVLPQAALRHRHQIGFHQCHLQRAEIRRVQGRQKPALRLARRLSGGLPGLCAEEADRFHHGA
jgi:hypothetical protein